MRWFNKNKNEKNEKINELENKVNDLIKQVKLNDETIKSLKNDLEQATKINDELDESKNLILKEFENTMDNVNNLMNDKFNELENNIKELRVENKNTTKVADDKYVIGKRDSQSYNNLSLRNGKVYNNSHALANIVDIIDIKNNLHTFIKNKTSIRSIGKLYNIPRHNIYKIIYNIQEGYFDKVIDEYTNDNSHRIYVNTKQYQTVDYKNLVMVDGAIYHGKKRSSQLPLDISQISELADDLEDYSNRGLEVQDISKIYNLSQFVMGRIIWNIEEGSFDNLINSFKRGEFDYHIGQKEGIQEEKHHFRAIADSYKKLIEHEFSLGEGGELIANNGRVLKYTIQDIISLKEKIVDFNNYPEISDILDEMGFTISTGNILIWRVEEGLFDDLIDEYLSRNYTYENKYNVLYINDKNTGLTIDKCNIIINCLVNETDKLGATNRLIKTYPNIESKYIRILCDEYNNPNLSKVLKKEVHKINKINNPQKRRENGLYS